MVFHAVLRDFAGDTGLAVRRHCDVHHRLLPFVMPWIDRGQVKSIRYRGIGYKIALICLVLAFFALGAMGAGVTAEKIPEWFVPAWT